MLPKKEKISKIKTVDSLVTINNKKDDDFKKLRKNRLFVTVILSISVVLCILFFTYRKVTTIIKNGQSIIPAINLNLPESKLPPPTIDAQIDPLLQKAPGTWIIYAEVSSPDHATFTYQRGSDSGYFDIKAKLEKINPITNSTISPLLPEGLKVAEFIDINQGLYSYLINLPSKKVFFVLINPDISPSVKDSIPQISTALYWSLVSQF